MKSRLRLEIATIVKKGYGTYLTWIAYCEKCHQFRVHFEPMYVSCASPTCSKGHLSWGEKLRAKDLLRILKRKSIK